jgi:PadR family transcriptional regulator, regulatory protein PadR
MTKTSESNPISEPVFYILLSLASGQKHGYAILKDLEMLSERSVMLSTSTLYSALTRLEDQGLVERIPVVASTAPGLPRKVYELTPQGFNLLNVETRRLKRQVEHASRFLALD